jgi:hypothetical protein
MGGAHGYVVYTLGESVVKKEIPDTVPTGKAKQSNYVMRRLCVLSPDN